MNLDFFFIQKYYYYSIAYFLVLISLVLLGYKKDKYRVINFLTLSFAFFSIYYIGSRDVEIGVDTMRYKTAFDLYSTTQHFFIRKDVFYDFLNFLVSRVTNFQTLLLINATLYILPAWYGLKKIFKKNYYIPFMVFLISPYFINHGINVMRSGIAGSIFILGLSFYYQKEKPWKWLLIFLWSVLFHISFIVPFVFFIVASFFNKTKIIFLIWIGSLLLSLLNINIISRIIHLFEFLAERGETYVVISQDQNSWINFIIFGFFPVIFALYNVKVLKYKDKFYKLLLNAYMLSHIPYINLISTEFASRLGYLAEFMMPILLTYPFLINPKIKIRFYKLKLVLLFSLMFMIKAYKILII